MKKNLYILLIVSTGLTLACGMITAPLALPAVTVPTVIPFNAPPQTQSKAVSTPSTAVVIRPLIILGGCWNIRSSAADISDNIIRVQCGGNVDYIQWAANGYLELTGGEYVCNQAVGMRDPCK